MMMMMMMAQMGYVPLFLIVMLQFTEVTGEKTSYLLVRLGEEVSLPCTHVNCSSPEWVFVGLRNKSAKKKLVEDGQIVDKVKSDRLRLNADCSLILKEVTVEDVGLYGCKDVSSHGKVSMVHLSAVKMSEHKDEDKVMLNCSVLTHDACKHRVEWLDGDVETNWNTSRSDCWATVTFLETHFSYKSKSYDLLKCNIKHTYSGKTQQFTFRPHEKTVCSHTHVCVLNLSLFSDWWWLYIIVAVGFLALVLTVVGVMKGKRTEGNKAQTDHNAVSFEADPERGLFYVSISYTGATNSEVRVRGDGDGGDEDVAVVYSTVKAPSCSAIGSTDLYANVN
ncbi:uncharacterized protein LOC121199598 isoform X2 [Toxotes jaculatrix]|uniref:uncharacterized protein LOC121199598 isoform X2 n=1 Tax=Toxotes jaculatrix TaxID=941984 RepID=UPI001B3AF17A|nr:uncharacterized protein LOC121199598 isoform X2 [Toxotes jaculatrix]